MLKNVRGGGKRYDDTRKVKKLFFLLLMYCWLRYHHRIFQINLIELRRLSPKRGILLYASLPIWKSHFCGNIVSQSYQFFFYSSHLLATYCYNWSLMEIAWRRIQSITTWLAVPQLVSVSASCSRCYNLTLSLLFPYILSLMYYTLFHYLPVYIA